MGYPDAEVQSTKGCIFVAPTVPWKSAIPANTVNCGRRSAGPHLLNEGRRPDKPIVGLEQRFLIRV